MERRTLGATDADADVIEPFARRSLREAAGFLFDAYRSEAAFAQLYGIESAAELAATSPIFDGICRSTDRIPGTTLGLRRDGVLVGVASYCPDLLIPVSTVFVRRPLACAAGLVRQRWIQWATRPRLAPASRVRWRAYKRLVREQTPDVPRLRVAALGVAGSARRTGVARLLLDAVAADARWRDRVKILEVQTWHESNVSIYERLGFRVIAQGASAGVDCWTMIRPIEAGRSSAGVARAPD